jgi:hypothetical protein
VTWHFAGLGVKMVWFISLKTDPSHLTLLRVSQFEQKKPVKIRAFYDMVPFSLVGVDRRFRGAYCLYHQGDE